MKKMPERTCVITKEKTLKKDLLRVVRDNTGNVSVDVTGKANGRGAYLKKDKEVINKAKTTKALERILEVTIPDSIYEEMQELKTTIVNLNETKDSLLEENRSLSGHIEELEKGFSKKITIAYALAGGAIGLVIIEFVFTLIGLI